MLRQVGLLCVSVCLGVCEGVCVCLCVGVCVCELGGVGVWGVLRVWVALCCAEVWGVSYVSAGGEVECGQERTACTLDNETTAT